MQRPKPRLRTPGPTPIPWRVQQAMDRPIVYHRGKEITSLVLDINEGLRAIFPTEADILLFASSGTGVMEAAVSNLMSGGDRALVVHSGRFGERWLEICRVFGLDVVSMGLDWGTAADPARVAERLKADPKIRAVFATQSETSTGGLHDVEGIGAAIRGYPALFVVDAISSLGAHPLPLQKWGVDCVVAASQKGLMTPPGVGVMALGARGWEAVGRSNLPKFYWSAERTKRALETEGTTPATPATTLLMGMNEALKMILEEGVENVWERHARHASATRAAVRAAGLGVFADRPSNALTGVRLPEGLDGRELARAMRSGYGVLVGGGQGQLAGKLIRISNLGYTDDLDVVATVCALEMALTKMGWKVEPGSAAAAAEKVLTAA